MHNHFTRALGAIAVAALALLGPGAEAQAKTEIEFWHAMEGKLGEATDELVNRFNQSQEQFEVKAIYKGTYPEVMASAIDAYQQKQAPHIVQVYDIGTRSMIGSGAIIPVHRLMQQQKIAVNWSDFIETVTSYYSQDGQLYSMPFNAASAILFYNKDIFKKAGLGDKPPATWADVESMSGKILAAGAAKCGFTTSWPSWTMLENTFAWHDQPYATNQNGHTGVGNRLYINSDFGLMHIGALAKWQKEGVYSYGGRMRAPDPKFINGDCAMIVSTSAFVGLYQNSMKFEWGTGPLPHWGAPYRKTNTIVGGASLWALRGREPTDYQGVAQFMKFVADSPQQIWWAAATGFVPVTKTAVKNLVDGGFFKKQPEQWVAVSALLNVKPTPNSRGVRLGNLDQVREVIEGELETIFAGKKTVKEALDAAVLRGNAILREFAVTHKPWPESI